MFERISRVITINKAIEDGLGQMEAAAIAIYGNGRFVMYQDGSGEWYTTEHFGEVLQYSSPVDYNVACFLAAIHDNEVPDDGVKTAVILTKEIVDSLTKIGGTEHDIADVADLLDYAAGYVERISGETKGQLLGGGLPYMTLIRPVVKYARNHDISRAAKMLTCALEKPLLYLAEASGDDPYAVYERVKALAPNQFYSLNQVGIDRSISVDTTHTDILTMGYDPNDGHIKDLRTVTYREKTEDVQQVLLFVKKILESIYRVGADI